MKHAKTWIMALMCAYLLIVGVTAWAIAGFERTLSNGQVVLVELAPVDPRSLMQGDYMALNFAVDDKLRDQFGQVDDFYKHKDTFQAPPLYAYLTLDTQGKASLAGTGNSLATSEGKIAVRLRVRHGYLSIGPNAFFFQEGTGRAYEPARWGELRVAPDGKALLVALRDKALVPIKPMVTRTNQ